MDWKFRLEEARIEDYMLVLGVAAEGPYDVKVRSPKVVAVLRKTGDNRRFPIGVNSYFPLEDMDTCMVYAEYPVNIRSIFVGGTREDIVISFDFIYGDTHICNIPLELSRAPEALEAQGLSFRTETSELILRGKGNGHVFWQNAWKTCQAILGPVHQLLTHVLAVLLLPWFFLDAVASILFDVSKTYPRNMGSQLHRFFAHVSWYHSRFCKYEFGVTGIKMGFVKCFFLLGRLLPVKGNRVFFLSSRRDDMTGNFSFLYDKMKQEPVADMKWVLEPKEIAAMPLKSMARIGYYAATSRVILIDDYTPVISRLKLRKNTRLIQLWHACGAFKTFGFSRTGKRGGPKQDSLDHRDYDYAIVSSSEIRQFYAEGFGIALDKVAATGVPRTDVFFDKKYKKEIVEKLQQQYPVIKGKKVILFAPTFRGYGKLSADYPKSQFDPVEFMKQIPEEYVLIIKHHPFVTMEYEIGEAWQNRILDLSAESEINDLLFVTDLLITDYSSVVFEAALLNIPMLMYAFDLRQYIAGRDFYYDYEFFVPGKIVESFPALVEAVRSEDYEAEKLSQFRTRFFDDLDGKSTERVVKLIYGLIQS